MTPQLTQYDRFAAAQTGLAADGLNVQQIAAMERDGMVQTALTLKKLGVLAAKGNIVAGDSTPEKLQFVQETVAAMKGSLETVLHQAMDAFAKGWSIQECLYQYDGRYYRLVEVRAKDPNLFGIELNSFGKQTELRLELPGNSPINLPIEKFVIYQNRPSYGRWKGKSDLDVAFPHYESKQKLTQAWRIHLEKFASPTVLGRFDRGISTAEQDQIFQALKNLATSRAIVHPKEIELSTLGGDKEASSGFIDAIDFHNREIARAILGQTLTTDEGRRVGSLALGKVHLQVFLLQLSALRKELADTVITEQIIRPLCEINFGPGPVPRFEFKALAPSTFETGQL